ncbi:hypothetical protein PACTADRAFT_47637 [Pachysolen tannophilus NRRL Y-2460]|uniref:Amino acid permease/ SLC12A domain-containing protein n=1 Tax=Pachysolen tannophilus NRRL Y-2460 TaxID=669874 RepID=A0A1E4U198_PACTA|nr:hypothetical protein PACTADRAFT_47637 [Pachysolen tannophilus NRRL Y-2460]
MTSIGELNTLYDFNFAIHASRWVDPAFGASVGWNYVLLWVCNIISEYVSLTSVVSFYSDKVPVWGYFLIFWGFFTMYQSLGVQVFGEGEYILSFVKITFLSGFYLFSIIFAAGGIKGYSPGNPFGEYPLAHGFKGIANSFVYAGVFYSGVEAVSMTASEAKNPRKAIPIAVKQTLWRILFVYFGASISYGITVAWNNESLSTGNKTMKSPMTIALISAGWKNAGYFVTTLIMVTCFSSVNSAIYISSRSLFHLAIDNKAPKIFTKVDKRGNPWVAVHTVHSLGALSMLSLGSTAQTAYTYIVNLAGVSAFIVWAAISFTQIRFRKGWLLQGHTVDELPYVAPFYPYSQIFAVGLGILLCLVQGWTVFVPFEAGTFVDVYILLPIFFIIIALYKIFGKTKWVTYDKMDFETDRKHVEIVEDNEKSVFRKFWKDI